MSSVWSIEELVERALAAAAEPAAKPERQPLRMPVEPEKLATPARPLPNGGWLRLATPGGAPAPKAPPPAPIPTPASLAAQAPKVLRAWEQLDLLAWRPTRREPEQLSLFSND